MMLPIPIKILFASILLLFDVLRNAGMADAFSPAVRMDLQHSAFYHRLYTSSDDDLDQGGYTTTSGDFAMDPESVEAKNIMTQLDLSDMQQSQLKNLAKLVVEWNDRVNLVSRKDCTEEVVFGRHILPCLAPCALPMGLLQRDEGATSDDNHYNIADVGTGGGFPGLPLAIAYPDVDFLLIDSVGKKLGAVQNMADRLRLKNVRTYHGRAETLQDQSFDVCVGRSVAAIPKYCFWIQNLLKKEGHLLYMIGGDIEEEILGQTIVDEDIDVLLKHEGVSDKRILVFPTKSVRSIAAASGEVLRVPKQKTKGSTRRQATKSNAKGAWKKKNSTEPKQRGYEGFQRYDSTA
jgi:16S rRNA (guanine527-N7)-methyltransferase